jgi:hypothetical protein
MRGNMLQRGDGVQAPVARHQALSINDGSVVGRVTPAHEWLLLLKRR